MGAYEITQDAAVAAAEGRRAKLGRLRSLGPFSLEQLALRFRSSIRRHRPRHTAQSDQREEGERKMATAESLRQIAEQAVHHKVCI
jgi:hypothetical protein